MGLKTNIYDNELYFALQFRDNTTLILEPRSFINEPMNWNKMVNRIPRDMTYFAFWSDFLEDKYGLSFTFEKNGGGQYLKDIYDKYGDQAEVYFSFGISGMKPIKSWRVNLQEYELDFGSETSPFGGVLTSIEKMPFQGKLKARMSAPCTINQYTNMDGDLLTPIPVSTLRLHSKTLEEETLIVTGTPAVSPAYDNVSDTTTPMAFSTILQPDQTNIVVNELNEVFTQPVGFFNTQIGDATSGAPLSPTHGCLGLISGGTEYLDGVDQFTPVFNGLLQINFKGSATIYTSQQAGVTNKLWWNVAARIVQMRLIGGIWKQVNVLAGAVNTVANSVGFAPAPVGMTATFPYNINGASQQYILPNIVATLFPKSDLRGSGVNGIVTRYDGWSWDENFTLSVQSGDQIFVHNVFLNAWTTNFGSSSANVNCGVQVDNYINQVTYNQQTTSPGTTSDGYRAFDILNQQLECITGQKNALISNYFSEGGAGYKFLFTNGYAIRNFSALINQPKKSLESFINDLQATFCLGVGIKEIDGIEYLEIEYISDFFKTLNILPPIYDTLEWKERHKTQFCYNLFQLGFNKWQGLDLKMQDEFNTQASYLTQFLKYGDNQFSKMSDIIWSGYILEEQRRNQFNLNSNQSLTEDETMFGIATSEPNIFHALATSWGNTNSRCAFFVSSMALLAGDSFSYTLDAWAKGNVYVFGEVVIDSTNFTCTNASGNFISLIAPHLDGANWIAGGGLNAGTLFTVQSETPGYPIIGEDDYQITPAPVDEAFCAVNIKIIPPSPNQIFAERNQPFRICTGVIDPSTIYNGRVSPKHILYNWRPLIGVGLYFINPLSRDYAVSQIVTTQVKMNSRFTTQFLQSETNKGNVGDLILNEFEREGIAKLLKNGVSLFTPIEATCKINIGWNDMETLRKGLSGELGDDEKDNGGITLRDSSGNIWFCHVMNLSYDLVKQTLTLTVQKCLSIKTIS